MIDPKPYFNKQRAFVEALRNARTPFAIQFYAMNLRAICIDPELARALNKIIYAGEFDYIMTVCYLTGVHA